MQRDLSIREVELKHLALQLELLTNQNSDRVTELQEQIDVLTVGARKSSNIIDPSDIFCKGIWPKASGSDLVSISLAKI